MHDDIIVLELSCKHTDVILEQALRSAVCDGHGQCSIGAVIDLIAAVRCEHDAAAPIAFELSLAELPLERCVKRIRLSMSSRGDVAFAYETRDGGGKQLTCARAARTRVVDADIDNFCGPGTQAEQFDLWFELAKRGLQPAPSACMQVQAAREGPRVYLMRPHDTVPAQAYCVDPHWLTVALACCLSDRADSKPVNFTQLRSIASVEVHHPYVAACRACIESDPDDCSLRRIRLLDADGRTTAQLRGIDIGLARSSDADRTLLTRLARACLGSEPAWDENLFARGLTSLELLRLFNAACEHARARLPLAPFLADPSLSSLSTALRCVQARASTPIAHTLQCVVLREPSNSTTDEPLSEIQRALWLASQRPHAALAYVEHCGVRLRGPLDEARLEHAYRMLVERHEALRTQFVEGAGGTVQRILPPSAASWCVRSLSGEGNASARLDAFRRAYVVRDFEPNAPLARAELLRLDAQDHVLVLSAHHALCDGSSFLTQLQELGALYASSHVTPSEPGAQRLQPRHLAHWERQPDIQVELQTQAQHWAEELMQEPAELTLPGAALRVEPQHRAGRETFSISAAGRARLSALARASQCSLSLLCLALFRVALYRHAGLARCWLGTPIAQRWSPLLEDHLGCALHFVPISVNVAGSQSLADVLEHCRAVLQAALERQHVPLHRAMALAAQRGASDLTEALNQLGYVYRAAAASLILPDLECALEPWPSPATKLQLCLQLTEADDRLDGVLEYAEDQLDSAQVRQLAQRFARLLELMTESSLSLHVCEVPWLTLEEQTQALAWACGPVRANAALTPELIAQHVSARPDAPAVRAADAAISYAELTARARRLATRLRCDAGDAQLCGLYLDTGVAWSVAVLAGWYARLCLVPFDPHIGLAHNCALLETANVRSVICERKHMPALSQLGLRCVTVEDAAVAAAAPITLAPEDLAFGVFTSGSTATPKLALLTHAGLANKACAQRDVLHLAPGTRVLQLASPVFDAALSQLMLALGSGGVLCVPPRNARYGGSALSAYLQQQHIEAAMLTPSVAATLDPDALPELKHAFFIGERCTQQLVARWSRPERALFNLYGPAEASIWSSAARCDLRTGAPSIGRPIRNVRVYVLDRDQNLLPVGASGEICIGGAAVGCGYHREPERTREFFVPDPHVAGGQLYLSGDRGRYMSDGQLELLGREDDQRKVNGRRVHLGELETWLHAELATQVVIAQHTDAGRNLLVGHVLATALPDARERLSQLRDDHRHAVLPTRLEGVTTWPRLASGKLDRKALALISQQNQHADPDEPALAGDPHQQLIAASMARVLAIQPECIGLQDSFYGLGGDSLQLMRLVDELALAGCRPLPLAKLLTSPTVRELALALDASEPPIQAQERALLALDLNAQLPEPELPARMAATCQCVLLTGATSQLGLRIVSALLADPARSVICLMRDADAARARMRLLSALRLPQAAAARVEVVLADLDAPRLGLSEAGFRALGERVDGIIHAAASVQLLAAYSSLRPTNVLGTRSLIELACCGAASELVYVSSLSALFPSRGTAPTRLSEGPPPHPGGLASSYGQSKAVAEGLLLRAAERGIRVRVLRPARMWATGAPKRHDLLVRFLIGCTQLRAYPDCALRDNIVTTDCVTHAIMRVLSQPALNQTFFHVLNPHPTELSEMIGALQDLGHHLTPLSAEQFEARMDDAPALAPLGPWLRETRLLHVPVPQFEAHQLSLVGEVAYPRVDRAWLCDQLGRLPELLPGLTTRTPAVRRTQRG